MIKEVDHGHKIWGKIMNHASRGLFIKFRWIPGNRNIEGNEEADQAA